jgi:hypothetical protein
MDTAPNPVAQPASFLRLLEPVPEGNVHLSQEIGAIMYVDP